MRGFRWSKWNLSIWRRSIFRLPFYTSSHLWEPFLRKWTKTNCLNPATFRIFHDHKTIGDFPKRAIEYDFKMYESDSRWFSVCVCVCAGVGFIHKSGWFVVPNETCWALNITILASLLWLGYGVINIKSRRLKYYSCEEKRLSGGLGCRWIHWVWFHLMCCGLFLLNMLDKYGVCKITRQHLLVVSFESSFNQWIYVKWLMLFPLPNWWIIPVVNGRPKSSILQNTHPNFCMTLKCL